MGEGRAVAKRFEGWHPAEHRAADDPAHGRKDPCLTELGIRAASDGIEGAPIPKRSTIVEPPDFGECLVIT